MFCLMMKSSKTGWTCIITSFASLLMVNFFVRQSRAILIVSLISDVAPAWFVAKLSLLKLAVQMVD